MFESVGVVMGQEVCDKSDKNLLCWWGWASLLPTVGVLTQACVWMLWGGGVLTGHQGVGRQLS